MQAYIQLWLALTPLCYLPVSCLHLHIQIVNGKSNGTKTRDLHEALEKVAMRGEAGLGVGQQANDATCVIVKIMTSVQLYIYVYKAIHTNAYALCLYK